jgi:NTE family protein
MRKKVCFVVLFLVALLLVAGAPALNLPQGNFPALPAYTPQQPVRVALVLGGGGCRGLAHLGAIRELEAVGIRPDLIIGCSAGSMIGALYADDPTLAEAEEALLNLKRPDLLDMSFFQSRFGPVKGKALQKFMKDHLSSHTFEELKIPLIVVATDLLTGDLVELSHGPLPLAVRASCSFPGLFNPVLFQGRYLVDGGVVSPTPVEVAKKYGAQFIIAIDVSEKLSESKPKQLFGIMKRGIEISYRRLAEQSLQGADVVIKMEFENLGLFTDDRNHEIYTHGREKALAAVQKLKQ